MSKQEEGTCVVCRVPEVQVENEADDGFDDDMASVALSQVQKANEEWHISETDIPWYVASQEEQKR